MKKRCLRSVCGIDGLGPHDDHWSEAATLLHSPAPHSGTTRRSRAPGQQVPASIEYPAGASKRQQAGAADSCVDSCSPCEVGEEGAKSILRRAALLAAQARPTQTRLVGARLAPIMLCVAGLHSALMPQIGKVSKAKQLRSSRCEPSILSIEARAVKAHVWHGSLWGQPVCKRTLSKRTFLQTMQSQGATSIPRGRERHSLWQKVCLNRGRHRLQDKRECPSSRIFPHSLSQLNHTWR